MNTLWPTELYTQCEFDKESLIKELWEMKSIVNRILMLLVTVSLTGVLALAKTIEKEVTFIQSVSVNGTLVKKGTYKVAFNEETRRAYDQEGQQSCGHCTGSPGEDYQTVRFSIRMSPCKIQPRRRAC